MVKKRIRYIFILMSVCIAGIIGFQAYWLYNAWDLAYDQFGRSINDAMGSAIGRNGFLNVKEFIKAHPEFSKREDSVSNNGHVKIFFHRRRGGAGDSHNHIIRIKDSLSQVATDSESEAGPPDLMPPSWFFIAERLNEKPVDLAELDSLFKDELNEHNIHVLYTLDTQRVSRSAFRDADFRRQWRSHSPLQTRWMRVNPVGGLYVQATFQTPYGYLFKKLLGVLIVSFILLALIIWCFVYMLNTILKQKKLSEIKNDFINNMTHELKTPIATVNAAVEAMKNFQALDDRSKTQSYLDISQKELQRLSDLVEKVLHISIEENNDLVLEKEKVNIVALMNEIIDRQQIKANKEVHFEFKHELKDPFIYVDKLHFSNAITNLIDNAIKYSGEKVHISIEVRSKGDQCIFIFKDDGIGIPAHYQPLIFDKFFRVPTGNIHNIKGFGLGLSYVKKVIEKHGGDIEVESPPGGRGGEPDKGTTFTFALDQT